VLKITCCVPAQVTIHAASPAFEGDLIMATFQLTYTFHCRTCDSANKDELFVAAVDRTELERIMRQAHLGCKFCGAPSAIKSQVKMAVAEASAPLPDYRWHGVAPITDSESG